MMPKYYDEESFFNRLDVLIDGIADITNELRELNENIKALTAEVAHSKR